MEIIPAILPKDFNELERKLSLLKDVFGFGWKGKTNRTDRYLWRGFLFQPEHGHILMESLLSSCWLLAMILILKLIYSLRTLMSLFLVCKNRSEKNSFTCRKFYNSTDWWIFKDLNVQTTQFGFSCNLNTMLSGLDQFIRDADFFSVYGNW